MAASELRSLDDVGALETERSRRSGAIDLSLISLARMVAIGGQLLYIRLFSTHLSTSELGLYFLLITVSYALTAALFVPMDYFQQSKVHATMSQQGTLHSLLAFNARVLRVVAGVGVGATALTHFIRPDLATAVGVAVFAACVQYASLGLRGYLNNLGHRRRNAFSTCCETVLKLAFLEAALATGTSTGLGVYTSWAMALTAVTALLLRDCHALGLFRRPAEPGSRIAMRAFLRTGYPISISTVVAWLQLQGYRMVLVPMGFGDLVGIYATVANVGSSGMGAATSVFAQMYAPKIYRSNGNYTATFLRNALVLIGAVTLVGWSLSSLMVPLLTSEKFRPYASLIVFGVLAEGGNLLVGAISAHLTLKTHTAPLIAASVSGLLTVVILFGMMVAFMAVNFATIAVPLLASQVVVVVHLWLEFRALRKKPLMVAP